MSPLTKNRGWRTTEQVRTDHTFLEKRGLKIRNADKKNVDLFATCSVLAGFGMIGSVAFAVDSIL